MRMSARSRSCCPTILRMALGYRRWKSTFEIILPHFQSSIGTLSLQLRSAHPKTPLWFFCAQTRKRGNNFVQMQGFCRSDRTLLTRAKECESVTSKPEVEDSDGSPGGCGELFPVFCAPAYVGSLDPVSKHGSPTYLLSGKHRSKRFRNR